MTLRTAGCAKLWWRNSAALRLNANALEALLRVPGVSGTGRLPSEASLVVDLRLTNWNPAKMPGAPLTAQRSRDALNLLKSDALRSC